MAGQCCIEGRASNRPTRLSRAAASLLPGAVLVLLPKCPFCLAAWLTAVTGIAVPAAGAAWVRGIAAMFLVAAVALAAAPIIRRRATADGQERRFVGRETPTLRVGLARS
jgi:hypothetical protein